jgi:hypothetical protein
MILADTLKLLTTFGPTGLVQVLNASGYKDCAFKSAEFLGMTNGGQFCYKVTFQDEERMEDGVGKVFVTYDQVNHAMTAGF